MCVMIVDLGSLRNEHVVPGWNEHVADKHKMARAACRNWMSVAKPRQGPVLFFMQQTRSCFKSALRYCQRHELQMGADMLASSLMEKDYKELWERIKRSSNDKATITSHVTTVGGCSGSATIERMWKDLFEGIYNSVIVDKARDKFFCHFCQLQLIITGILQ